jgi:putative transposase
MYGAHAVSEQALAGEVMERLPAHSVVVGDRNFGVFSIAHAAHQKKRSVLLRLRRERFQRLAGWAGVCGQDQAVVWLPSRDYRRAHPEYHSEAAVPGRILVAQLQSNQKTELLYLFTTLDLEAQQILEMYRCRWRVETDLRSLKNTIHLQHIEAKSVAMMEKELLLAITAYNMVRAVMGWAAEQSGVPPRSLSFSQVQDVVMAALPILAAAADEAAYGRAFHRMLEYATRCRLPKRSQRRSFPRLIWGHHHSFHRHKPKPLSPPA